MSLATAGIYCTTSLPLSRATEDSSIVQVQQLQILYRGRYSMNPVHVTTRTSATRRRSLGRYNCEMPDSDRWTSVLTLNSTLWRTDSQCSWRGTGVYERWVPVTRQAAAFWTDCNRGTSVLPRCRRTESCSSPGDRRRTPGPMFYSHHQPMTGQPAVAGAARGRLFDRPQRREPNVTAGHILLMVLWNQATGLSLTVSNIFNGEYDAMVDMTLNDL